MTDDGRFYVDKLAYAQSLFDGAGRIASTARDAPIEKIGIPFFLLVGFGIENALKAFVGPAVRTPFAVTRSLGEMSTCPRLVNSKSLWTAGWGRAA
jgi:hypothetical protein